MLEGVLEKLLLQFLAPYVERISRDKLHFGVISGALELFDLTIKADALALLGWDAYRVRRGRIGAIRLSIPWSTLYTGKVQVSVEGLQLEVENIASDLTNEKLDQLIAEMREVKRKAIDIRMQQLAELLQKQEANMSEGANHSTQKKTMAVKLVRKILHNLTVSLSEVQLAFFNDRRGLACALEFLKLEALSTDETFRERDTSEQGVVVGASLYKILQLQDLSVRMAPAGCSDLLRAEYIVSPLSARLQLAHIPGDRFLHVRLEVATKELAKLTLARSQVKHLRAHKELIQEEKDHLLELVVPPAQEMLIFADAKQSRDEYSRLYEKMLRHEWRLAGESVDSLGGAEPLSDAEQQRTQLLEDAFSIRVLARARLQVRNKLEALNQVVASRQLEAEKTRKEDDRKKAGFWGRFRRRAASLRPAGETPCLEELAYSLLTETESAQLLQDLGDESKFESVDLPQRMKLEFVLGQMDWDLLDDRWSSDDAERQVMGLSLTNAHWTIDAGVATDHRGQESAEWRMELSLSAFHAFHRTREFFTFCLPPGDRDGGGKEQPADVGRSGAKLVVQSLLKEDMNLLCLLFRFAPMEIHMLPGVADCVMEFWRTPALPSSRNASPPMDDGDLRFEDLKDMSKEWLEAHRDQAREFTGKVYERIPDRIQFDITIASPILHVPVDGHGTAILSLGELSMRTPKPCTYTTIAMEWFLDNTTVTAKSLRGERFDMIQPVPIRLTMLYRGLEEENDVNLDVNIDEMLFNLSPQAIQILLATPSAMLMILYPQDSSSSSSVPAAAASAALPPVSGDAGASPTPELSRKTSLLTQAQEVLGSDGDNIIQAAARKVEQVRRKQFRLNMSLQWRALGVTLADSIVPVMRLRMELMPPGLVLYQQSIPYFQTVKISSSMLEVDVLNPRNGAWEPFVERVHLGFESKRKQANELQRSTHVVINGYEPLLVNITPTIVRRVGWLLPPLIHSLTVTSPFEVRPEITDYSLVHCVKYRVINLCYEPIELLFQSAHKENLAATIQPTGSAWESLDDWVLPHFATAIAARFKGSSYRYSEMLSLERIGVVTVPGSGYVAQLLTPEPSHRLLLLATPLRVHNKTDLALQVRYHDATEYQVLQLSLPSTHACDATLVGHAGPECAVHNHLKDSIAEPKAQGDSWVIELAPNSICAVPAEALVRAGGAEVNNSRTWLSLRPAGVPVDFCAPREAGASCNPCTLLCRGTPQASRRGIAIGGTGDVHLLLESEQITNSLPYPTVITTVTVQPALAFINALPIGQLAVRYAECSQTDSDFFSWREVKLPSFARMNIYNFRGTLSDGIVLQARFQPGAPWSHLVEFEQDAIQDPDNVQTIFLCQSLGGAAAGVTVEPVSNVSLRLTCPNWLADRSGLPAPSTLEVHCNGAPLPQENGITLLPADVLEEPCEFVLLGQDGRCISAKEVQLPPSSTVFPWRAGGMGSFVFCIQAEDIAPADVFGAQCQVMVLRPRLVLTNASECDIEIRVKEDRKLKLPAGHSREHHWQVQADEDDQPTTTLRFRPVRSPPCQWSGTVLCGDTAAGSTPFALAVREGASETRVLGVEVWSVDVAPMRGALAVSFREGSDFVAVNLCTRTPVQMSIRAYGCDETVADVPVPLDKEVPFGWTRPFTGRQRRLVEVFVNGRRFPIEDVRRAMRRVSHSLRVVVAVHRVDSRTFVSVQELEGAGEAQGGVGGLRRDMSKSASMPYLGSIASPRAASAPPLLQFDIKVSRIGVSIVEEAPIPRELLYLHFDLIRFHWSKTDTDIRSFRLAISEAQVDCQLPGRVDAYTSDRRRSESLSLFVHEQPAVILANCADGDRAFLNIFVQRGATSSRDILLHRTEIAIDSLDITIDDGWLDPLATWIDQTRSPDGGPRGMPYSQIKATAGRSVLEGYVAPELPSVVQVDQLEIGAVSFTMWCSLKLKTVRFLPQYLRTAIRVLSFSGQFTLDGAHLFLSSRTFPPHRGSLKDFLRGLANEYTINLINNAGALLGRSSVLNLPRAPLRFFSTGLSYVSDSFGLAAGEAATLMAHMTFDDDYIAQQRGIRESKRISGLSDGMVEAGKSLAQSIEGFADIWLKPIEGAQKAGVQGFFSGLGKGVVGTIWKPLEKLGQACSDFGSGVAAQVAPDTVSMKRRRARVRHRQPRLLFTSLGAFRPWSELEAEVLRQLGPRLTAGVEEVLPLTPYAPAGMTVLLLFCQRFLVSQVKGWREMEPPAGRHSTAGTSGERQAGGGGGFSEGGGSSSSSSAPRPGRVAAGAHLDTDVRAAPMDLFEAIDESALKLFSQALKPINTLVYGVQDMEQHLSGKEKEDSRGDPDISKRAREFIFTDLKDVHTSGEGDGLVQLEDTRGGVHSLPLFAAPFGVGVRRALVAGFRTVLSNANAMANWDELRRELLAEWRQNPGLQHNRAEGLGAGERVLEVFEVERRTAVSGEWSTPALPVDRDLAYRWVDATGSRHPHLIRGRTSKQCAHSLEPPCELSSLFRPTTAWCVDKSGGESDGWKYGLAWNSSTWGTRPGLFDAIRRRRWTRTYE